jgi:hypothetical protein
VTSYVTQKLTERGLEFDPQPILVPPTWSKGEHYLGIERVWARAAKELSEAQYIFILGYSLPETDQFFRLLFALGTEGKVPLSRIELFDPNANTLAPRFHSFLGHATLDRFKAYELRFAEGIDAISKTLLTMPN